MLSWCRDVDLEYLKIMSKEKSLAPWTKIEIGNKFSKDRETWDVYKNHDVVAQAGGKRMRWAGCVLQREHGPF